MLLRKTLLYEFFTHEIRCKPGFPKPLQLQFFSSSKNMLAQTNPYHLTFYLADLQRDNGLNGPTFSDK